MHKNYLVQTLMLVYLRTIPKKVFFEKALKLCRRRVGDAVRSTTRIALSFAVEIHISLENEKCLGWKDGPEKMLYLKIRTATDDYALKGDPNKFEIL